MLGTMPSILSQTTFPPSLHRKPIRGPQGRLALPFAHSSLRSAPLQLRKHTAFRCQASEGQRFASAAGDRHPFIEGISTFTNLNGSLSDITDARKKLEKSGCTDHDEEPVWDDWAQFFEEMDFAAQRVNDILDQMRQAVALEDYSQAACLKRELDELIAKDTVHQVLQDLDTALANEDYVKAAELRDAGGAGLLGWWCGRGEDDPFGHLLHISDDFGRYVGTAYTPKDLAEVKGWTEENFFRGVVDKARSLDDVGSPIMEVFVQKREDGSYRKQVCALTQPEDEDTEVDVKVVQSASTPDIQIEEGETDGGHYVKIEVTFPDEQQGVQSSSNSLAAEEALEDGPRFLTEDSDEDELSSSESTLLIDDNTSSLLLTPPPRESQREVLVQRVAATLCLVNRDKLEFEILQSDEDDSEDDDQPSSSGSPPNPDNSTRMTPTPNRLTAARTDDQEPAPKRGTKSWLDDAPDLQNTLLKFAKEAANFHMKQKSSSPSEESAAELSKRDELLREMEKELLRSAPSARSVYTDIDFTGAIPFTGKIMYDRLPTSSSKTDPFSGMFLGAFGPHGPELLQLKRVQWKDGEDAIYGVKVTGDPNVPAGSLSFRALVGRRNRLDPHEEYPPELGVVARYKGEGRVAHSGFKNAKWVEGELLQFSPSSPVTRGAELGFVWQVPNEKKFLILLNRINLE